MKTGVTAICTIAAILASTGDTAYAVVYYTGFEVSEGYTGVAATDASTTGMITNHADWSGGAQASITNDNHDWGTNADGSYGDEKVVNYESFTGDQSFRLNREYGSSGQGSLFGPLLGASMPTNGSSVKLSFAFKPVSATPDDSHLSVQSGAASGQDKGDHLAWIEYSSESGPNNGLSVGNWDLTNGGNMTYAATGLDPSVWHTVEATLMYGGGWTTGVPGSLVAADTIWLQPPDRVRLRSLG